MILRAHQYGEISYNVVTARNEDEYCEVAMRNIYDALGVCLACVSISLEISSLSLGARAVSNGPRDETHLLTTADVFGSEQSGETLSMNAEVLEPLLKSLQQQRDECGAFIVDVFFVQYCCIYRTTVDIE